MGPAPFAVNSEELAGGIRAISVRGELDLSTAPDLERALEVAHAEAAAVLVDLSGCEFIDSTGIALIVRAWQRSGDQPRLALCCADAQVRRLLEVTGVQEVLALHDDRESALAALASAERS